MLGTSDPIPIIEKLADIRSDYQCTSTGKDQFSHQCHVVLYLYLAIYYGCCIQVINVVFAIVCCIGSESVDITLYALIFKSHCRLLTLKNVQSTITQQITL